MDVETWTQRVGGVTFVSATVTNEGERRRVRVAAGVEPVWPPRRHGVPRAGWDDDGFEGVVSREETLVLGFATPARAANPVEVAWTEPAGGEREDEQPVATLGDPRPPRDAVPTPRVVPEAVDSWLDAAATRVETAQAEPADREALRRVAARARAALRGATAEGES